MIGALEVRAARRAGGALCVTGLALLASPSLIAAAVGLELMATAFWWWARAAEDAAQQVPRWAWLRRPAAALWLAAAIHAVLTGLHAEPFVLRSLALWRSLDAAAVVWAGL